MILSTKLLSTKQRAVFSLISTATPVSLAAVSLATAFFVVGCGNSGVGDPCVPESIPEGGFIKSDTFLETSSVSCRTRVCMVYQHKGDPRYYKGPNFAEDPMDPGSTCPPDGSPPNSDGMTPCPELREVDEQVFCTAKCSENGDCPDNFICHEVFSNVGGPGIRGSYCVSRAACRDDKECSPKL